MNIDLARHAPVCSHYLELGTKSKVIQKQIDKLAKMLKKVGGGRTRIDSFVVEKDHPDEQTGSIFQIK